MSGNSSSTTTTTGPGSGGTVTGPSTSTPPAEISRAVGLANRNSSRNATLPTARYDRNVPGRRGPPLGQRHPRPHAERHRQRRHQRPQAQGVAEHQAEQRAEQQDELGVGHDARPVAEPAGRRHRGHRHPRRHERHDQGEGDDLARPVGAGHEELRVAAQHVEHGLRDGHAGQAGQDRRALPEGRRRARRRARHRCRGCVVGGGRRPSRPPSAGLIPGGGLAASRARGRSRVGTMTRSPGRHPIDQRGSSDTRPP